MNFKSPNTIGLAIIILIIFSFRIALQELLPIVKQFWLAQRGLNSLTNRSDTKIATDLRSDTKIATEIVLEALKTKKIPNRSRKLTKSEELAQTRWKDRLESQDQDINNRNKTMSELAVLSYERNGYNDSDFYTGVFNTDTLEYKVIETGSTRYASDSVNYSRDWTKENIDKFTNLFLPTYLPDVKDYLNYQNNIIQDINQIRVGDIITNKTVLKPRKLISAVPNMILPDKLVCSVDSRLTVKSIDLVYYRILVENTDKIRFYKNGIENIKFCKPDLIFSTNDLEVFKNTARYDRFFIPY